MPFALLTEPTKAAIDPDTGAKLVISSGPQIEFNFCRFTSSEVTLTFQLEIRRKYSDKPVASGRPENPCIMVSCGSIDDVLRNRRMTDYEANSRLVLYILKFTAFINRHFPLANAPYFWSDYEHVSLRRQLTFSIPSDEELIRLSL